MEAELVTNRRQTPTLAEQVMRAVSSTACAPKGKARPGVVSKQGGFRAKNFCLRAWILTVCVAPKGSVCCGRTGAGFGERTAVGPSRTRVHQRCLHQSLPLCGGLGRRRARPRATPHRYRRPRAGEMLASPVPSLLSSCSLCYLVPPSLPASLSPSISLPPSLPPSFHDEYCRRQTQGDRRQRTGTV